MDEQSRGQAGEAGGEAQGNASGLDQMVKTIERKLSEGDFKTSVGDFIRLLQLYKEAEEERPSSLWLKSTVC